MSSSSNTAFPIKHNHNTILISFKCYVMFVYKQVCERVSYTLHYINRVSLFSENFVMTSLRSLKSFGIPDCVPPKYNILFQKKALTSSFEVPPPISDFTLVTLLRHAVISYKIYCQTVMEPPCLIHSACVSVAYWLPPNSQLLQRDHHSIGI